MSINDTNGAAICIKANTDSSFVTLEWQWKLKQNLTRTKVFLPIIPQGQFLYTRSPLPAGGWHVFAWQIPLKVILGGVPTWQRYSRVSSVYSWSVLPRDPLWIGWRICFGVEHSLPVGWSLCVSLSQRVIESHKGRILTRSHRNQVGFYHFPDYFPVRGERASERYLVVWCQRSMSQYKR